MGVTGEFLTRVPRRADGKRDWPAELKARIVAETLIEGETVKAVAKRYELIPRTVLDWRGMARQGKLVLPNLDGMNFVPVEIDAPVPVAQPLLATFCGKLDVMKGDVTVRLDAATPAILWTSAKAMTGWRPWCRASCARSRLMGRSMCSAPSGQIG